jgi:hypothetical protein
MTPFLPTYTYVRSGSVLRRPTTTEAEGGVEHHYLSRGTVSSYTIVSGGCSLDRGAYDDDDDDWGGVGSPNLPGYGEGVFAHRVSSSVGGLDG